MERTNYPENTEAKQHVDLSGASSTGTEPTEEHHDKTIGEKMKEAFSSIIPGSHHKEEKEKEGTGTVTTTSTATKTDE